MFVYDSPCKNTRFSKIFQSNFPVDLGVFNNFGDSLVNLEITISRLQGKKTLTLTYKTSWRLLMTSTLISIQLSEMKGSLKVKKKRKMKRTGHGNIWGTHETKEKTTKNVPLPDVLKTFRKHQYLLFPLAGYCIKLLRKSKNLA